MDVHTAEGVKGEDVAVQNAQELARRDPMKVPERYIIRNQEDMPRTTQKGDHLSSEIPVIDFSLLTDGNQDQLQRLEFACKEWGFCQVVNHGVAVEVMQDLKHSASEFFELPFEEKNKCASDADDWLGYGHAFGASEEQKLDWSDALTLIIYPLRSRKLKFWPNEPKEFKERMEVYSSEMKRVGEELLRHLSLIMEMEKDTLLGLCKELEQGLRVNYYPPCSVPDQVLGLSPHSDIGILNLLMQDENVNGLHIKHGGEWVPVKPIPNALVVNIGDIIEIWSNGKYRSIEHRAVTNKNLARFSFAYFMGPDPDAEVEPFDHMVHSQQSVKKYEKVRFGDYKHALKRKLEGKTHLPMAKNED